jgi:Ca2+-binding EF-hand superfamily protein
MHFLDDEDNEVMQKELKEAFRLYDKDGECKVNNTRMSRYLLYTCNTHKLVLTDPTSRQRGRPKKTRQYL